MSKKIDNKKIDNKKIDFFDEGYIYMYPDVKKSVYSPKEHYLRYGISEGRDNGMHPSREIFYEEGYMLLYSDIDFSIISPWYDYVLNGVKQGRSNGIIPPPNIFFEDGYRFLYPDVSKSKLSPWEHYVKYGKKEGRSNGVVPPSNVFFEEGYKFLYSDVSKSELSPWEHYVKYGKKEGRSNGVVPPSNAFFEEGYRFLYPDVKQNAWRHFVLYGSKEGRCNGIIPPDSCFSKEGYEFLNPDVVDSKSNPWRHYVLHGFKENRIYNPVIQLKEKHACCSKRILLIAHEISVTGAPLSLKSIAKVLINMGYSIEIWTFPKVFNIYDDLDCNIFAVPNNCKRFEGLQKLAKQFDFIICNTIVTGHYSNFFFKNNIPHLWIIREGEGLFDLMQKLKMDHDYIQRDLDSIVVVSEYTQNLIYQRLGVSPRVLYNFIEDVSVDVLNKFQNNEHKEVIEFTFCGTLEKRKGLDILIYSFLQLNILMKNKWRLNIVGELAEKYEPFWGTLKQMTESYDNIIWHNRLVGDEKWRVFVNTDVFVIPSLDEACSRIVLEGAMLGKTFIASRNVGAVYLAKNEAGMVFKTSDCQELIKSINKCLSLGNENLKIMGMAARKNYIKTSTPEIYQKKLLKIVNRKIVGSYKPVEISTVDFLLPGLKRNSEKSITLNSPQILPKLVENVKYSGSTVAVVIPVYNGLEHLKVLLPSLFKNTDSPHKFYFVNDCSNRETVEWLRDNISRRDDCILINNENNLGFPATVNRAVSMFNNDFVILNTDTQVPPGWLKRLIAPIENDDSIATVTPLSSCATIFSFPIINSDECNKKFTSLVGVDKIDQHCSKVNYPPVEVPVGHGFCMAISRKVWENIGPLNTFLYGKGYGEEVDFCQRAVNYGYKNVAITNLFVGHWHRGSFSKETKEIQLKKSEPILENLYPNFRNNVRNFVSNYILKHRVATIFSSLVAECISEKDVYIKIIKNHTSNTYNVDLYLYGINYSMSNLSEDSIDIFCKMIGDVRNHNIYLPEDVFIRNIFESKITEINKLTVSPKCNFHMVVPFLKEGVPTGSAFVRCIMPWSNDYTKDNYNISISLSTKNRLPQISSMGGTKGNICYLQRDCQDIGITELSLFIQNWKSAGNFVIYDLDDDFFAYEEFAKKAHITNDDACVICEKVKFVITHADAVMVSTENLKRKVLDVVTDVENKVYVIKNLLDDVLWEKSNRKRNDSIIRIGYVGTRTHIDDMRIIEEAVIDIQNEFGKNVEFYVVGCGKQSEVPWGKVIPSSGYSSYHNFCKWLSDVSSDWDIALIPLEDNEFNRGKSNLKFLEFSSLGMAIVVSDINVYQTVAKNMQNCLVAKNTKNDWYRCIKSLIENVDLRKTISKNAYNEIKSRFTIQNNVHIYRNIIESLKS